LLFSVRTGTILAESKLSLQKWLLAHRIFETWQKDSNKIDIKVVSNVYTDQYEAYNN
jgi:hypothetical protein